MSKIGDLNDCDPIPRGHISLVEAFQTLRRWRGFSTSEPLQRSPERDTWVEKWEKGVQDLLETLADGRLVAYVCDPGTGREYRVTCREWVGITENERDGPFVLPRISEHANPSLNKHSGRTPYLNEEDFERIFKPAFEPKQKSSRPLISWAQVKRDYQERLNELAKAGRPWPTDSEDWVWLKHTHPGASRQKFRDDVRKPSMPSEICRPGRRRKPAGRP